MNFPRFHLVAVLSLGALAHPYPDVFGPLLVVYVVGALIFESRP